MKIIGIIAEYNPFHQGHQYHIEETRRITGADYIIALMSGDFVQRGEPAVFDKYTRSEMALRGGTDLVIELPSLAACGSAEDFASCGVSLFHHMGCVDGISFGSEHGDITALKQISGLLAEEPEAYRSLLKEYLRRGESFPKARELALTDYISSCGISNTWEETVISHPADGLHLLSEPNNILGIEYLKALHRRSSTMAAYTVRRIGQGYNDKSAAAPGTFPSASAIRNALKTSWNENKDISKLPNDIIRSQSHDWSAASAVPVFPNDLSAILNWELLRLTEIGEDLTSFSGLSKDIADRLKNKLLDFTSFSGRIDQLKTKQYTYTRLSRALIHLLLNDTEKNYDLLRKLDYAPYIRVLGFRKDASVLLSALKKQSDLPIITKTADASKILSPEAYQVFRKDLYASHLYQTILSEKKGTRISNEYTRSVIII